MISDRMYSRTIARAVLAFLAIVGFGLADMSAAFAQSQNCGQIVAILRGIERNEMFVSFNGIVGELQNRQAEVRQAENSWRSSGCEQLLGRQGMSAQCQSLARTITLGRTQVEQLVSMASEGQSLARDHQQLMSDYARNGCSAASGVNFNNQGPRGGLLDNMFGGGYDYVDRPFDPWSLQQTRRTVCVRTCDGFYWPISFSTTDAYVAQDAIRCHEMCPGTEVALFSYRNPGQEPEDMISLAGTPYTSMPYAFRFRDEVDMNCSCQMRETVTTIEITEQVGQLQADVAAVEAEAIYVPLPRPRPREDGTAEATVTQQPDIEDEMRIVEFGDTQVRIVGPETPYVPEPEEES